uniref:Uncharacterized protein n=1 Tax=Anopheles farauti TaxID=69004 RepID=A0A182QU93_9DIPT
MTVAVGVGSDLYRAGSPKKTGPRQPDAQCLQMKIIVQYLSGGDESGTAALLGLLLLLLLLPCPLLLVLDKVIEEARPRFRVIVVFDITGFHKVQKHVPGVLRDAPDVLVLLEKVQPALQDVGRVYGKHEPPQAHGHIERQYPVAGFEPEPKRKPIQRLEVLRAVGAQPLDKLLEPRPDVLDAGRVHALQTLDEFGLRELTHLARVKPPRQYENREIVRLVTEITAQPLDTLGQYRVLLCVLLSNSRFRSLSDRSSACGPSSLLPPVPLLFVLSTIDPPITPPIVPPTPPPPPPPPLAPIVDAMFPFTAALRRMDSREGDHLFLKTGETK